MRCRETVWVRKRGSEKRMINRERQSHKREREREKECVIQRECGIVRETVCARRRKLATEKGKSRKKK
jgi:hypothetical protein